MFKKFTNACVTLVQKYLPDPFLFCIILTAVVFIAAMPLTKQGPLNMVMHWGDGVWSLLEFSMQMALVLVLGTAMATSPPMQKVLKKLAAIPKTPFQSIVFVTFIALVACWINWGFGLIVGAILAKEVAKQGRKVDYRLLIASAYSGFLIWHGGISGSIPLTIANVTETVTAQTGGVLTASIPSSQTIFSPWNLIICVAFLIILPLVNAKMHPSDNQIVVIDPALLKEEPAKVFKKGTGIVNFFIPSGGGQWAVQGPIMMPAGAALGVAPQVTAMSIAWGRCLDQYDPAFLGPARAGYRRFGRARYHGVLCCGSDRVGPDYLPGLSGYRNLYLTKPRRRA